MTKRADAKTAADDTKANPTAAVTPVSELRDAVDDANLERDDAHRLIYKLETAGIRGHGLDADRTLHMEAAAFIRTCYGLAPADELKFPAAPAPFGKVKHDPPMGHSLPDAGDSQR